MAAHPLVDLDLVAVETYSPEPDRAPQDVPAEAPQPGSTRGPPGVTSKAARGAVAPPSAPAGTAPAGPEAEPTTPLAPSGTWSLRVTKTPGLEGSTPAAMATLGLDGANHFLGERETPRQEAARALEESNKQAGQAMRSALHASDVALGLGSGGAFESAIKAVVRDSSVPEESKAVLVAVYDANGAVQRVDVESASDGAYASVAEEVLKRLQGQRIRVPAGSRGVAARVAVASTMALPSGGGVGIDVKNAGGHFDVADVAARPRRVVHARIVSEDLL